MEEVRKREGQRKKLEMEVSRLRGELGKFCKTPSDQTKLFCMIKTSSSSSNQITNHQREGELEEGNKMLNEELRRGSMRGAPRYELKQPTLPVERHTFSSDPNSIIQHQKQQQQEEQEEGEMSSKLSRRKRKKKKNNMESRVYLEKGSSFLGSGLGVVKDNEATRKIMQGSAKSKLQQILQEFEES